MRFSFLFPAPRHDPQKVRYKGALRAQNESKVILVNRAVTGREEEAALVAQAEQGHYLVGICAYENWPARNIHPVSGALSKGYDFFSRPVYQRFVGFMHHFREPDDVFPGGLPLLAMDFSDFVQVRKRGLPKRYDLLYYAGYKVADKPNSVPWSSVVKQHDLALHLIRKLLDEEPDVRICLVNDSFGIDDPRVEHVEFAPYRKFLDLVEASRVMLVASWLDASPRVITEALCLDTPIMVNERIIGGWKYVVPETGAFFDQASALDVYRRLRARGPVPTRAWFLRNYANDVLEQRFDTWLNQCIHVYCVWNRFGRVFSVGPEDDKRRVAADLELFGRMGIYADCVERAASPLEALRQARDLGLPDVVILADDFRFLAARQVANRKLTALLEGFPTWDALLFGSADVRRDEATHDPAVRRVLEAGKPRGYAVKAACYDRLIAALEEASGATGGSGAQTPAEGVDRAWAELLKGADVFALRSPIGE
jgi:hypothetical protein